MNLLRNPPKITDKLIQKIINGQLDIKLYEEELDAVLNKIKNRKAASLDDIPPAVWKTKQFDNILLSLCYASIKKNTIEKWMKVYILPFHKKGNFGITKNYRSITLTATAAKVYNNLLHSHIHAKIKKIVEKNQNSF